MFDKIQKIISLVAKGMIYGNVVNSNGGDVYIRNFFSEGVL